MDSFNQPGLWDLSLPPSLPALADDDFIALLQKQFGINHGFPIPMNDTLSKDSSNLYDANAAAPPQTANIDPKSLSRVPLSRPSVDSPPSDDSSPSPSNANEASGSRSRRQSTVYGNDGEGNDDDPTLKRKASEEDLDDEPTHKSQHTSSAANKSARRKSTGNPNADESRLQKRKEQNRAAQRAFRERKEKHVKDLEDQVAALEEKHAATAQENETLREVVSRLQSENMRLRQSNFTFAVPQPSSSNDASSSGTQKPQMGVFNSPPSTCTSTTASSHDSPESVFANEKEMDTTDPLSFLNGNLSMLTSMDGSDQSQQQTATADTMNMDFGFGPSNNVTPYTTIASNPLFMSFRESDAFDPMTTHQNRDRTASSASSTKPVSPFDFSSGASSHLTTPNSNNNGNSQPNGVANWPDFDMQAFDLTLSNSLDELFGNVYGIPPSSQQSHSPNSNNFDFLTGLSSVSGLGKPNSGSSLGATSSLSPINHQITPPISTANSSPNISTNGRSCTKSKEMVRQCMEAAGGSIFVPSSNGIMGTPNSSNASSSSGLPPSSTTNGKTTDSAMMDKAAGLDGEDDCNEFPRCKGLQLPKTTKNEKNVEVMRAWKTIRTDPNFKDVDINELCSEFASKAKCDGCQVVIEPEGLQEILDSVTRQRRKKKQSELFRTSEMVLAGADQMGMEATQ